MSQWAMVALAVGAAGTILGIVFVVLVVVQRVTRAYREATRAVERLQPALNELAEHQQVTRRELARIESKRQ